MNGHLTDRNTGPELTLPVCSDLESLEPTATHLERKNVRGVRMCVEINSGTGLNVELCQYCDVQCVCVCSIMCVCVRVYAGVANLGRQGSPGQG